MSSSTPATDEARQTIRARKGVLTVFAAMGFSFASWASRVPDVKSGLHLTPGRLSLLLLAISVGSVVGLPLAGRIVQRVGPANGVLLGIAVASPGVALTSITVQARGPLWLAAVGLVLGGGGVGVADVSQNLEGTIVERAVGRAIMPWFHAAYSLGTVAGAVVGVAMTYLRVPVGVHVTAAVVLGLAATIVGVRHFTPRTASVDGPSAAAVPRQRSSWLEPRTLLIGVMVLAAAFTEGSANDWMAVAFVDGHHVTKALGVVAFTVFLSFMTFGRIGGTRLLDWYGRVAVLRVLFTMAIAGCLLVVFGSTLIAFVGTAVWGLGASLGFPVGMSAAADDPSRAAPRLSTVSSIGYCAFLAGPPALGFLGDQFGSLRSLLLVGAVGALAILVVPIARPLPGKDHAPIPVHAA